MATLHLENLPDNLYEALRKRAEENRRSISAEVIDVLEASVPTEEELARRAALFQRLLDLQAEQPLSPGPFPTTEEMLREDRER